MTGNAGTRRRRAWIALASSALACAGAALWPGAATAQQTVVSLGFDDNPSTQWAARDILAEHGMKATFFVNSGLTGDQPGGWRMTWSQLEQLAADGHEIAGHTLTHADLTRLSPEDQRREVCDDRANLLAHGFAPVSSFAYPYGSFEQNDAPLAVQQCGYASGRTVGYIRSFLCATCPYAESIPPANPFVTRTAPDIRTTTTLETMQGYVTQAEQNGGGWVQLVFHHICDGFCDDFATTPGQLDAFLDWLEPRALGGTVVRTVSEVTGTAPAPDTTPPQSQAAAPATAAGLSVEVGYTAADQEGGSGLAKVDLYARAPAESGYTRVASDVHPAAQGTFTYTPAAGDGTYSFYTVATDKAGNVEPAPADADSSTELTLERVAPSSTAAAPSTSTSVHLRVDYTASDDAGGTGLERVELHARAPGDEDFTLAGTDMTPTAQGSFDYTASLGDGTYAFYTVATDRAGNEEAAPATPDATTEVTVDGSGPQTVVSLEFDDNPSTQWVARDILAEHGMPATFFVNSGLTGDQPGGWRMTWSQLAQLAAEGHEIGGHTLTHADLTQLSPDQQRHEACDDRANLLDRGFAPVSSFAYPYGSFEQNDAPLAVQQCGYSSARTIGFLRSFQCPTCPFAESIPPANPFATRTAPDIRSTTTLEMMQGYVTQAEQNGGGWVQIVFHHVCDNFCDDFATTPGQLDAFLDWLEPRAIDGTVVRTVGEVTGTAPPPPPPDTTAPQSAASAPAFANGSPIQVRYTAADDPGGSGLSKVDLYARAPGATGYTLVATDTNPDLESPFSYPATAGDGPYGFYTVATDKMGNAEAAPPAPDAATNLDTAAPSSSASAPAAVSTPSIAVGYSVGDGPGGSGADTVELYVRTPGDATFAKVATDPDPGAQGTFAYTAQSGDGAYAFYTVATDNAGNVEAAPGAPDAGTEVTVDTTPPSSAAASPATSRSPGFPVAYTAADTGGSGLASVELWARAPGASGYVLAATDNSPQGAGSFSYVAAAGEGTYSFHTRARDGAGNREDLPAGPDATTTYDVTSPTAFSMVNPPQYLRGTVGLAVNPRPTDAGSGVASVRYQYRRAGTTTWRTGCLATLSPWGCSVDTTTMSDGGYVLRALAADVAGNPETVASNTPISRSVDNTAPAVQNLTTTNSGTARVANRGDTIVFTFRETMSSTSLLAGWSGSQVRVQVRLVDDAAGDSVEVLNDAGTIRVGLASRLSLGGDYVPAGGAVFGSPRATGKAASTMVLKNAQVTVTLGTISSGGVRPAVSGGTLSWTPDAAATDLAGNPISAATLTKPGPAF